MSKHTINCIVEHYERYGIYLLNERKDSSEFVKGRGDGMLRVASTLRGKITGSDVIHAKECICKLPKVPAFDQYKPAPTKAINRRVR